ncbi:epidermal growth factor receptor kinase substrate 8-like protein 3b [Megalops cyprinoides]|uniref:epidermal growth factor receptor kinase substrate 8-like protein 3b n=1 Tax=Megalops cyprinoides TaxID=118141 RepID=UPI001864362A|nr:epidermal growth factor receptor kinase substrate 8-like protein 3b [Megalops cyprinoides]
MFGNNRPYTYESSNYDAPPQSYGFPREDPPSQRSSINRPSGKSIYMQRKEYSESMNRQPDNFQYRVEHLFTCDLDGREVCTVGDCVTRLKTLNAKGRIWGQEMILEVRGLNLQLTDIETKGELESLALGSITQTKAVLDSCVFDSLLTITVEDHSKRASKVFLFQCEEVRAEDIKEDLDKAIKHRADVGDPYKRDQNNIRDDLENIIGQQVSGNFRQPGSPPMQLERYPPPPDHPPSPWNGPEYNERGSPPPLYIPPREEPVYTGPPPQPRLEAARPQFSETERNVEIFNHVVNDVEFFMSKVTAAASTENNKKKKKKSKKATDTVAMPAPEEFASCLQKIKYGFNLLGKLNGQINNPSAPDFVHCLFSILGILVKHCHPNLPASVLIPLLTEPALQLLNQEVTPEEDRLWLSLGDSWNIPRSKWPDGDRLPAYVPEFYDGWQLPPPPQNPPISRSQSQRLPVDRGAPSQPLQNSGPWNPTPPRLPSMRVIYDFVARNHQELSVMKGEIVQVLDQSKQWWKVRNSRSEEGHIPQNVLEPLEGGRPQEGPQDMHSPPTLNKMSRPEDVRAWLEYKGFSKITVNTLSMLNGALLLAMTRDELRKVCPEEGGRVFFQLQAVKSAIALASESGYDQYNGH